MHIYIYMCTIYITSFCFVYQSNIFFFGLDDKSLTAKFEARININCLNIPVWNCCLDTQCNTIITCKKLGSTIAEYYDYLADYLIKHLLAISKTHSLFKLDYRLILKCISQCGQVW